MQTVSQDLDLLCVNTLRTLSIDAVQKANSGHPGLPLGAAPMAFVLWQRHLAHDPSDPTWPDRDRFVLSAGHGSALLYSLLHTTGYPLSLDDLKSFRQWHSRTPGHPETFATVGVEATTGPLGQGAANSVGMALTERMLAARFNKPGHKLVDHYTYALLGDGCMMEGVTAEAASFAGQQKLGKLIWLYDSNDITLDGPTSLSFSTEDVAARFRAYGWQVQRVERGDSDLAGIDRAIAAAKADATQPSLIIVRTTIGFGSPARQGTNEAHGSPLGTVRRGTRCASRTRARIRTSRESSRGAWPESCPRTSLRAASASCRAGKPAASRRGTRAARLRTRWRRSCRSCAAATPTCRARPRP
jgi:transketolase